MAIQVQVGDQLLEFPETMTEDEIKQVLRKKFPKQPEPIQQVTQTPQEQYIQDVGGQPDFTQLQPLTPKELAMGGINVASYLPVGAPLRLGRLAKGAYELGVPAILGAGARYMGEREKGLDAKDAASTAIKQAGAEIATGAALSPVLKLGKAGIKKLSAGIPDDLYKKAKEYSQKKSKPLADRIQELKRLGDKAGESNQKINKKLQDLANKATDENKSTANKISNTMSKLSTKFFENNSPKKLTEKINDIDDDVLSAIIEEEHQRLIKNAKPIIQDGAVKTNREAKTILNDFRDRFMVKSEKVQTKLIRSKKDPDILIPKKQKVIEYSPIKDRIAFFKEMRLISDKSTFGEGKKFVGQSYAKIHKNFNDFLKNNSKQYKDQKELGQALVNFSKLKPEIADTYDKNKIQKAIKESLETFDKSPDPDSVERINDFLKQAKKYKFKTDIDLKKYNNNLEAMKFKKLGTKGLTQDQINALPDKVRQKYLKNQDLFELTKEPLFTGTKKAEQVATDPSKMGRIMELLPPELRRNIEIEDAKRSYDALTTGILPKGEIPYVSPFVNQYLLASQIARKGLKSPALQGYAKKIVEGDTRIKPEIIKAGAQVGGRAVTRQFFGEDQMPQTREELMQQRRQSQNVGQLRTLEQIKKERGL